MFRYLLVEFYQLISSQVIVKPLQVVSERFDSMGPPTTTQRLDLMEEKVVEVEGRIQELVTKAVESAVEGLRHSLTEILIEGQALATKQLGSELEALSGRLEGRIGRSRDYHESMIQSLRNEQLKFQAEMRSALNGPQFLQSFPEKMENTRGQGSSVVGNPNSGLLGSEEGFKGSGGRSGGGVNVGGDNGGFNYATGGPGHGASWRYRKLDMPVFDGTDPDGWLLRVERYFKFYRMSEEDMLDAAAVAMDGEALRCAGISGKTNGILLDVGMILSCLSCASFGQLMVVLCMNRGWLPHKRLQLLSIEVNSLRQLLR